MQHEYEPINTYSNHPKDQTKQQPRSMIVLWNNRWGQLDCRVTSLLSTTGGADGCRATLLLATMGAECIQ